MFNTNINKDAIGYSSVLAAMFVLVVAATLGGASAEAQIKAVAAPTAQSIAVADRHMANVDTIEVVATRL